MDLERRTYKLCIIFITYKYMMCIYARAASLSIARQTGAQSPCTVLKIFTGNSKCVRKQRLRGDEGMVMVDHDRILLMSSGHIISILWTRDIGARSV